MVGATIAIDAMGGDHGLAHNIKAANKFLSNNKDQRIILVGDKEKIVGYNLHENISVEHAEHHITMEDSPVEAIKNKKNSSLRVTLDLVKQGKAVAAVSAGNTGAVVALAKFVLGMQPGIKRPVLAAEAVDCNGRQRLFLDLGANVDCSAKMLHQFATLGREAYMRMHENEPNIALFNVGKEQIKGSVTIKEAAQLIEEDDSLKYIGFVEGDNIIYSNADIIVVDGFTGNIALKSVEGAIKCMLGKKGLIRDMLLFCFKGFIKRRIALLPGPAAMLLGVNQPVFKIHGSASQSHIVKALNSISNLRAKI